MISGLQNLSVQLGVATWVAFLLLVVGAVAVVWHYRGTNPPTGRVLRRGLAILRMAALWASVAMLASFLVQWTRVQKVTPELLILQDVSSSMRYVEGGRARWQRSVAVVQELTRSLSPKLEIQNFGFGTRLRRFKSPLLDSTQVVDEATDLAGALSALGDSVISAETIGVVVISDGAYNRGADPASAAGQLGVPVWAVCLGDSVAPRDVAVADATGPEMALVGESVPIRVRLRYSGIETVESVPIVLEGSGGRILNSKTVKLDPSRFEVESTLTFVPDDTGLVKVRVAAKVLPGEVSRRNNRTEMFVRVLPRVRSLLLLAGSPSPDVGFLRRELASDSGFSIVSAYEVQPGRLSRSIGDSLLRSVDGGILVDFPATWSSPREAKRILSILRKAKKPLIVFAGSGFNWSLFRDFFADLVPENVRRSTTQTVDVLLAEGAVAHPLLRVSDYEQEARDLWSKVAPVSAPWMIKSAPDSCGLLMVGRVGKTRATVLGWVHETHHRKAAVFAMAGFWRWRLAPVAYGREPLAYRAFVRNLGEWLVAPRGAAGLEVLPEQLFFEGGAPVTFRAHLYDLGLRPVDNAIISVKIQGARSRDEQTLLLEGLGNGLYRGQVPALPAGAYRFSAVARVGDRVWGPVEGKFAVKPFVAELSDLRARPEVLRRVASASGGSICVHDESLRPLVAAVAEAADNFQRQDVREEHTGSWSVKTGYGLLVFLLVSLVAEWTLRRRHGLL